MSTGSIALVLLSSLFHALWNVLTQGSRNSQFLSGLKGLWIMLIGAGFLAYSGIDSVPSGMAFWIILSGILHGTYILSLSQAYNTTDISYAYPIARSAPVFVPLFAWFLLGERFGILTVIAILVILAAVYLLHFDGNLRRGFKNLFDAILHQDLRWSFITLGLVVAYSLVDKQGMALYQQASPDTLFRNGLLFFFLEGMIGFTLCNIYLFSRHKPREILDSWREDAFKGLVAGIATIGSYGLICVVLQMEPVSQVVAVRQTSVMMVVLWGVFRLGEPFGRQRMGAAILVMAGVALIGLDPVDSAH